MSHPAFNLFVASRQKSVLKYFTTSRTAFTARSVDYSAPIEMHGEWNRMW